MQFEDFRPGEEILTEGLTYHSLWIILSGRCEVVKSSNGGKPHRLAVLEPGCVFGEMSFLDTAPHSASVRTLSDVVASLDQPLGDGSETAFGDLMASQIAGPEEQAVEESVSSEIETALSGLHERERDVLELRYGLRGGAALSLRDAGKQLGISAERTRQLEEQALRRLADNDSLSALRDAA